MLIGIITLPRPMLQWLEWDDVLIFLSLLSYYLYTGLPWTSSSDVRRLAYLYHVPQAQGTDTLSAVPVKTNKPKTQQRTRDVARWIEDEKPDVVLFWGSQSGTAQVFARRFARQLQSQYAIKVEAADLDDYDHETLTRLPPGPAPILGFVLATYGEGDPPDNAYGLSKALVSLAQDRNRDDAASTCLSNLRYIIFGLGNSKYRHYNHFVDVVEDALQGLGATRIGSLGKADDAAVNSEEHFSSWTMEIEDQLEQNLRLTKQKRSYQPSIVVRELVEPPHEAILFLGEPHRELLMRDKDSQPTKGAIANDGAMMPLILPIVQAQELITAGDRHCVHLELDLAGLPSAQYQTGDHLAVWPMNPEDEIDRTLRILGLEQKRHVHVDMSSTTDHPVSLSSHNAALVPIPTPTTIETLFRYYLDLCGPVSRTVLTGLAEFAPGPEARASLGRLTNDPQVFASHVSQRCLSLSRVLQDIEPEPPWQVPLSYLVENLNMVQPRYYSISSSALVQPHRVTIAAAITVERIPTHGADPTTTDTDTFHGLASSYLFALAAQSSSSSGTLGVPTGRRRSSLRRSHDLEGPRRSLAGGRIFACIRPSHFKLPANPSTAIIMIGTGTGVAPFRGFVQERAMVSKRSGTTVGKMILVLGFRHREEDYLYQQEWRDAQESLGHEQLKLWVTFSRQGPPETPKANYVQHSLAQHADEVFRLLHQDPESVVYLCGSIRMARDVEVSLVEYFARWKNIDTIEAQRWFDTMRARRRWQEDVWG